MTKLHVNMQPGQRLQISLVDLSGESSIRYTPLALMCLKAEIESHPDLAERTDIRIHPFLQSHSQAEMIEALVTSQPHVVGFSCQGWNFRQLVGTWTSLRQYLPDAVFVLGGNHVSHRGDRLLPAYPEIDVIVNGEGEIAFRELIEGLIAGSDLYVIPGLSLRKDRDVYTVAARDPVRDLEQFRSPYIDPGLSLGKYDIALLETNRGCPYHCAFCYWGGRVGQKLARSQLLRVQQDIEAIGEARIDTIFLCDANFGILAQDVEIAKIVVETYQRYGYPREFNVNWAKNHATRVGEILGLLIEAGIHTAINIPMQTRSLKALQLSGRTEAGRAGMFDEAQKLVQRGIDVHCELIFGMPGESLPDFMHNYDALFVEYPNLRIHPLWILPNTTYDKEREKFKIRTISPDLHSDYEAIFSHFDLSSNDMREGLALLLSHEILVLLGSARNSLRAWVLLTKGRPSLALKSFETFLRAHNAKLASEFVELFDRIRKVCYFERSLRDRIRQSLYRSSAATLSLMEDFLQTLDIPAEVLGHCLELARYDACLLPRGDLVGEGWELSDHWFAFDPVMLANEMKAGQPISPDTFSRTGRTLIRVRHKSGLAKLNGSNCDLTGSYNGKVVNGENHLPPQELGKTVVRRTIDSTLAATAKTRPTFIPIKQATPSQ